MDFLIPYKTLYNHQDPFLDEFTYGDIKNRGRMMKKIFQKGGHLFFHRSIKGKKCITAYYIVDRVLDTAKAVKNRYIFAKYQNPHLKGYIKNKWQDDVIVFGDPILSRKLERPLLFDRNLAKKLSLSIKFKKGFTDTQCIGSATRSWRKLNKKDVNVLLKAIKMSENKSEIVNKILSTDEVSEIIEKDLENFIETNPQLLGKKLKLVRRQPDTSVGRMDLIFEHSQSKKIIVVELKLNKIGRDALNQLQRYMNFLKKETKKNVQGILVCKGVMPAFEKEFKNLKNIKIFKYGWELKILPL